jgi:hypothetical protein
MCVGYEFPVLQEVISVEAVVGVCYQVVESLFSALTVKIDG